MEIEDYISKRKKFVELPTWATYYHEIEDYDISEDKLKLIKAVNRHINYYYHYQPNFKDGRISIGPDEKIIQAANPNGGRIIAILKPEESYYNTSLEESKIRSLNESEFKEKVKFFQPIGSQKLYKLSIDHASKNFKSTYIGHHNIYYTEDGHVYINKEFANKLREVDIDELGNELADQIIKLEKIDKEKRTQELRNKLSREAENYSGESEEAKKILKYIFGNM